MPTPSTPDHALQLLAQQYAGTEGRRVWVADENWPDSDIPSPVQFDDTLIVTNRIDVYRSHIHHHAHVELSDFAFEEAANGEIDALFFRVSKEKPVVHHVINASAQLLREGGALYLTGNKGDGTKTYFDKAKEVLGVGDAQWKKAKHGAYGGRLTRSSSTATPLDCQDYPNLRPIAELDDARFDSKPGIFGWNKIDLGSALLIEHLPRFVRELSPPPATLLDLGCGFGYLAVMAGKQLGIPITATDNNVAAVAACEHNMEMNAISGNVMLDDCGSAIDSQFDAILCNPPFHRGFSTQGQLTQRFLQGCHRLLAPGGAALFVVNQFIPLETLATPHFARIDRFGENGSFKLVSLRH